MGWGHSSVVEHVLHMPKALDSTFRTSKKKKKNPKTKTKQNNQSHHQQKQEQKELNPANALI
jgi:hypothetical protein